jgi:ferritin-like metal-binding protein YciE
MSPLPNEHSCRLANPKDFISFRRRNNAEFEGGLPIDVIYGIKARKGSRGGKTQIQALRYSKNIWSEKEAREHCEMREGEFHPSGKAAPKQHSIDVSSTKNATLTHDLTHSKLEEGIAIRSYRERTDEAKKLGDAKTAQLYEEIIKDERDHEEKFRRRLKQI